MARFAPIAAYAEDDPTVQITKPVSGSTLAAGTAITVEGTAFDRGHVKVVKVRVDDGPYTETTPKGESDWSTWSTTVDITATGSHTIVAKVYDKAGHYGWSRVPIVIANSNSNSNDTSRSGNSSPPTTSPPPSQGGDEDHQQQQLDGFGVKKIYLTKTGGNEWYVNMNDPTSDPTFKNLPPMTKQSDGSWQVSKDQVRMEAWSPPNQKWLNVEITEYAKIIESSDDVLQMYSRGGHHSTSDPCLGSAVKARLYGDGEAAWVKEVTHPAYAGNRGNVQATDQPLDGRWVGFKAVIYNIVENGKTYVHMESYIDDDVTDANGNLVVKNNWKLASVYEDKGGWATDDSDFDSSCSPVNKDSTQKNRQTDEIINMPGGTDSQNLAAFRSDQQKWNFKYLSVREIDPSSKSPM